MSNKMWGGRFKDGPDAIMEEINVSIDVDRHLYAQDIAASKAHAAMLAAQGIITALDAKNIAKGLDTILSEIGKGSFTFKRALEDIHMFPRPMKPISIAARPQALSSSANTSRAMRKLSTPAGIPA